MIYVLQVQSGKELYIRSELERKNITAYVPRELLLIRKGGLWSKMTKLLFPGYVFADIEYTAKVFHEIKPISGVIGFLGEPSPLPRNEAEMILWLANNGEIIEPSTAVTDENDEIIGFKGFLNSCEDRIIKINRRQKKASVSVNFDGKSHNANISFDF